MLTTTQKEFVDSLNVEQMLSVLSDLADMNGGYVSSTTFTMSTMEDMRGVNIDDVIDRICERFKELAERRKGPIGR